MSIRVPGVYQGKGILKLEKPVDLEENTRVNVVIETTREAPVSGTTPRAGRLLAS